MKLSVLSLPVRWCLLTRNGLAVLRRPAPGAHAGLDVPAEGAAGPRPANAGCGGVGVLLQQGELENDGLSVVAQAEVVVAR